MKILKLNLNSKGETNLIQTLMVAGLIVSAFFIGMLWTRVQIYEKGGNLAKNTDTAPVVADNSAPTQPTKVEPAPVSDKDFVRGNRSARIALIEYSDLECPFCKVFHPTAKRLLSAYGDKIMWVYRHFPLDIHPKARSEAEAASCAAKLGGNDTFWAYIDKIYEITPSNNGLDPAQLPIVAGQVGLNIEQFKACQTSGEMASVVTADIQSGVKAGINGTPGNIFLDTKTGKTVEVPGAVPYEQLKQTLDTFLSGLN